MSVELSDVVVRLDRADVLRGVSLTARPGEVVAVVGPNGSGKTTLLRTAMGFVPPASGVVRWAGDTRVIDDPRRLASLAAYLPQTPTAPPLQRVSEAIALGRFAARGRSFIDDEFDRLAVEKAATVTGVAKLLDRRLGELSGGQRQRVMLARCIAQGTPTLVLDEPTTFLDLRHQLELSRLFRDVARAGRCVLMTSHDLNLAAAYADRVAIMSDGRVVADGPPAEVLTAERVSEVFGVRVERVDVGGVIRLIAVDGP